MLTQAQKEEYDRVGAIVVPDVLSPAEVAELRAVTDGFVERRAAVTAHDEIYDLEDSHTPAQPRVRRIKAPHLHARRLCGAGARSRRSSRCCSSCWGPDIRFDTAKLNMKSAGFGAAGRMAPGLGLLSAHQRRPRRRRRLSRRLRAGERPAAGHPRQPHGPGPTTIMPTAASAAPWTRRDATSTSRSAVPLTGPAGSITIHHVRAGAWLGAQHARTAPRRLLLLQYRAADAWPLLGFRADSRRLQRAAWWPGEPTIEPRLDPVPVRLPLPPARHQARSTRTRRG